MRLRLHIAHEPHRISQDYILSKHVSLGASDVLKIILTTQDDKKAKQPHQAFLNVRDLKGSLETSFAFQVKENGKAKLELVE